MMKLLMIVLLSFISLMRCEEELISDYQPDNMAAQHHLDNNIAADSQIKSDDDNAVKKRTYILEAVELTQKDKDAFVVHNNKLRGEVNPPATNMLQLQWDEQLATLAKSWSRKCRFGHNPAKNRKTATFKYVGENMYFRFPPMPAGKVLVHSLNRFLREAKKYKYNDKRQRGTGHFTQMVWANTYAVGCGVTNCGNLKVGRKYWAKAQVVACNYGPGGNVKGQFPYKSGRSCSECPLRRKCVCSAAESLIP